MNRRSLFDNRNALIARLIFIYVVAQFFYTTLLAGKLFAQPTNKGLLQHQQESSKLVLAANGKTDYQIVLGAPENSIEKRGGEELQNYFQKITGATFSIKKNYANHSTSSPYIFIGHLPPDMKSKIPDVSYSQLGKEGFVIRRFGPNVHIAGNTPRGTLFGVYHFLEEYAGVKWLAEDFTVVPAKDTLAINTDTFKEQYIPRFTYRELFFKDGDDPAYRAHNRLNGNAFHRKLLKSDSNLAVWSAYWPPGNHNFHKMVPDTSYWSGGQLKAMNDTTRAIAAQNLLTKIKQRIRDGKDPAYGFSQEDARWQPENRSLKFAQGHGDALSAPIIDMVKDIGARIKKEVSDARLATLAYQWSFPPPQGVTVPEYITITLAPIEANLGQTFGEKDNEQKGKQIKEWAELASNIVVWDYLVNFGGYILPYPNLESMSQNIRFLARLPSVQGYFGQGAYSTRGVPFANMRMWVASKLLWDPNQNYKDLMKQFAEGYYDEGAPYIIEYLDLLNTSFDNHHSRLTIRTPVTASYLSFDAMRKADVLFTKAVQAVKDKLQYLKHVSTARLGVDYVILMRRDEFKQKAVERGVQWNINTDQRLQRFKKNVKAAGLKALGENVGDTQALFETVAIEREKATLPEFIKTLSDSSWIQFNDLDIRNYTARYVADSLASDGGALRIEGKRTMWGIQLPFKRLPKEGEWKLLIEVRVDPSTKNDTLTAFRAGIDPGGEVPLEVHLKEVNDGRYHWFQIPGSYSYDENQRLYFEPPGSPAIEFLYVDRIFAINTKSYCLSHVRNNN